MALKLIFNPISGTLDWIDEANASVSGYQIESFTLNATDITNKYVTLASPPSPATSVAIYPVGGSIQFYGDDYTVSGSQVGWNGLGLDGLLASGDKLVITYKL